MSFFNNTGSLHDEGEGTTSSSLMHLIWLDIAWKVSRIKFNRFWKIPNEKYVKKGARQKTKYVIQIYTFNIKWQQKIDFECLCIYGHIQHHPIKTDSAYRTTNWFLFLDRYVMARTEQLQYKMELFRLSKKQVKTGYWRDNNVPRVRTWNAILRCKIIFVKTLSMRKR